MKGWQRRKEEPKSRLTRETSQKEYLTNEEKEEEVNETRVMQPISKN